MWEERGNSIHFDCGMVLHKSAPWNYALPTYGAARRKMKRWFSRGEQSAILNYLKIKGHKFKESAALTERLERGKIILDNLGNKE